MKRSSDIIDSQQNAGVEGLKFTKRKTGTFWQGLQQNGSPILPLLQVKSKSDNSEQLM